MNLTKFKCYFSQLKPMKQLPPTPEGWEQDEDLFSNQIPDIYKRNDQIIAAYTSKYGKTEGTTFKPEVVITIAEEEDGSYVVFRNSTDGRKSGGENFEEMEEAVDYAFDYMREHPTS